MKSESFEPKELKSAVRKLKIEARKMELEAEKYKKRGGGGLFKKILAWFKS